MENNLGNIDRFIRLILGIVFLIIAFASHLTSGLLSYTVIGFGMVLFATAVVGVCPLYKFLKYSTV